MKEHLRNIFFSYFFPIFPLCSKMEEHLRNRYAFHTYFFTFSHYIHTPCKYHTRAHTLPGYLRESSKDLFRSIHYRQGIPLKRRAADLSSSSELRGISSGIYGLLYAILPRSPCAENVFVYKLWDTGVVSRGMNHVCVYSRSEWWLRNQSFTGVQMRRQIFVFTHTGGQIRR